MGVQVTIKDEIGQTADLDQWALLSLDTVHNVNKIPWARLVFKDGDFDDKSDFEISSSGFFKLGAEITIKAKEGVDGTDMTLFKGFVARHSIRADLDNSVLIIELKDATFRMTRVRKSGVFGTSGSEKNDKEVIKEIIENHYSSDICFNPESSGIVIKHSGLVQYYCSDWDFILSRAEANGCWVMVHDGTITVKKAMIGNDSKKTFSYADETATMYSFHMELDGRHHYNNNKTIVEEDNITGKYYEISNQRIQNNQKSDESFKPLFQSSPSTIDESLKSAYKLGGTAYSLLHSVDMPPEEAKAWADAYQRKTRLALFKGRIKIAGYECVDASVPLQLGDTIKIKKMAKRFNGNTLITGIRHRITLDGWFADVQFGMSAEWFTEENKNITAPPAGGLLPAVNGLHIGKVLDAGDQDRQDDAAHHYKVKVEVMGMGAVWVRMASPYAGKDSKEYGFFFRPEIGDEVVLGFLNDDPRHAIILGSLYSEKKKPPFFDGNKLYDDEGKKQGIMTKGGLRIECDDTAGTMDLKVNADVELKLEKEKSTLKAGGSVVEIVKANNMEIKVGNGEAITIKGKTVKINGAEIKNG